MQFPIQHAAPSLRGKAPAQLPHGFLPIPPEVKQLVEEERAKFSPEAFANGPVGERWMLNYWTIDFYFDALGYEVMYRETADGPEVVAVGPDETTALRKRVPSEQRPDVKTYLGY
jgi:hypothetical protein